MYVGYRPYDTEHACCHHLRMCTYMHCMRAALLILSLYILLWQLLKFRGLYWMTTVRPHWYQKSSLTISHCWPLLASLLSFTTAEIDQIKRGFTGEPSVKAAAMLNSWREKTSPTYIMLREKVIVWCVTLAPEQVMYLSIGERMPYYSVLSGDHLLQRGLLV